MTVFLFFDESGDTNFSLRGSRYYFFGALTTRNPGPLTERLTALKYRLMERGYDLPRFHAAEDRQQVRNHVFEAIASAGEFEFDSLIVEKRKADPTLHDAATFYPQLAQHLLRYVFDRYTDSHDRIVIVTDEIPVKRHRRAVEKAFKTHIAETLGRRSYLLVHHSSYSHACLQAADYCTWAIHKKWHHGDLRPYDIISSFVKSEFDIFAGSDRYFY